MSASTYEPLASITLSTAQTQVTFSSIPQIYTDLIVVINPTFSVNADVDVIFNGDTQNNYSSTYLTGNGTTATSGRFTTMPKIYLDQINTGTTIVQYNASIMNYSNNVTFKTVLNRYNGTTKGTEAVVGLWRNTAAITSMTFTGGGQAFSAGSTFNIYGVGAKTLKADGGDIITTDGVYWYHVFNKSGIFIPKSSLTCDYLVVAGGGGGGGNNAGSGGSGAGGGGGGGLRSTVTATGGGGSLEPTLSLSANTSYAVTIGSGGAGGISNLTTAGTTGTNGSNTTFSTIIATGGGGGGGQDLVGANGGSGGGGGSNNKSGGSGTTNQGYAGGSSGNGSTAYRGGGGGGAGAAGTSGVSSAPVGGNGVSISQLAIITGTGVSNNYAGGGGGGSYNGLPGAGGAGGGGAGAQADDGGFGVPNTGGGGGGAGYNGYSFGGNGGSGLVIVRYAV